MPFSIVEVRNPSQITYIAVETRSDLGNPVRTLALVANYLKDVSFRICKNKNSVTSSRLRGEADPFL